MIDYDFYVNSYLGSVIPEKAFPALARRSADALAEINRRYQVRNADKVSEKMALCAIAETLYSLADRKTGVKAATVGGVSVQYEDSSASGIRKRVLDAARIYLDIYRGVSA